MSKGDTKEQILNKINLPIIVKPLEQGSSIGITKVLSIEMIELAISEVNKYGYDFIVEKLIDGYELTCPVVSINGIIKALPIVEIVAPNSNYDYKNKYFSDEVKYICPAKLEKNVYDNIQNLCIKAYQVLGCKGVGRIDLILDKNTLHPMLLEMNTCPGMTDHSLVPMSVKTTGQSFSRFLINLLYEAQFD